MLAAISLKGLGNKIARVRHARIRILQGSWVEGLGHPTMQGLANKIDRVESCTDQDSARFMGLGFAWSL